MKPLNMGQSHTMKPLNMGHLGDAPESVPYSGVSYSNTNVLVWGRTSVLYRKVNFSCFTDNLCPQLHLSNKATPGVPRLEDVGVSPLALEDKALPILRRYRDFLHFDRSLDELEAPNKS